MAEKVSKPTATARREPQPQPHGVLAALPSTRPERLGRPRAAAAPPRRTGPQAVRPASTPLTPPRHREPPPEPLGAPKGAELVTTTIRAAGELTKIGLTVGTQSLKGALRRLPRP